MSDDIQDATHAFGIVLRSRVGNDLDAFDRIGGHTLQHFLRIVCHHLVRLVVHIHLERTGAVHLYIVLAIDSNHRHLTKHLDHSIRLRIWIVLDIIGNLVDVGLDERLLFDNLHALQFEGLKDAVGTERISLGLG